MKKNSPSSNCSAGLEDLGLGLKGQMKSALLQSRGLEKRKDNLSHAIKGAGGGSSKNLVVIEDFYKARKVRRFKIAPTLRSDRIGLKVAPCIRAEHHNTDNVYFIVSGQMTTTNMPAKSIEQDSETKNSSKATSEISEQARYLSMTYLQEVFPVKLFPLRENARVFKTKQGELFSTKYAELLEVKDQNTYSLRMLKDYFLTTRAEPSQLYSFHWMSLGMMSSGRCLTLSIGCPRTGKGSLSSVLEEKVNEKYYLSEKMIEYLKRHVDGRAMPIENDEAYSLTNTDYKGLSKQRFNVIQCGHRTKGKPRFYKDQIPAMTQDYGTGGQNIPLIFQRPRGKNKGGIKEKISPTISISDFEHNNLLIANTVDADGYLRRGKRDRDKNGRAILTSIPKRRIRRLTPKECERLQGFPDDWTEGVSDTQRYKAMGNAVSVPVIEAIGRRMLNAIS